MNVKMNCDFLTYKNLFQMHLPYSEGLPSAIVSTGFILFLFGKMVTVPTNVVQVLQTGTKSPPAIRVVDFRMVL
jgi:hypothetical protein